MNLKSRRLLWIMVKMLAASIAIRKSFHMSVQNLLADPSWLEKSGRRAQEDTCGSYRGWSYGAAAAKRWGPSL